jgi:hypothetical protein
VERFFYWKGLKSDVMLFVQQCQICQQAKSERVHPAGLLQPLPVPRGAWEEITMDFIEGLPKSEGFDIILVVVDRFTKFAHFLPLKHPFTAQKVAQVFLDQIVEPHVAPKSIVSDRDKLFTSQFWRHLFQLMDVQLLFSTAYHPQTDGQSERVNQCLEMSLRCAVNDHPQKWKGWLALAVYWYNTSYHSSLGCTPFIVMYGYDAPAVAIPCLAHSDDVEVNQWLTDRAAYSAMLKEHLTRAQHRMKQFADKGRTPREFSIGNLVLLKLQSYAQKTGQSTLPKTCLQVFWSFSGSEQGRVYGLSFQVPQDAQVHPVFHVSQLKLFHPRYTPVFATLPRVADLSVASVEPEDISDHRLVHKRNQAITL